MAKLISEKDAAQISEDALEQMKSQGGDWYAYQNHDMGHPYLGHLQFLQVGPECTYKKPPGQYPDTQQGIGWRYLLVGKVDLEAGKVVAYEL